MTPLKHTLETIRLGLVNSIIRHFQKLGSVLNYYQLRGTMIKFALAAAIVIGAAAPAMAAPERLDAAHAQLWDTLEKSGVRAYVNHPQVCDREVGVKLMGMYTVGSYSGAPILVVCQDHKKPGQVNEVEWSLNDLDTLRHESTHYLQDCLDGNIDLSLSPLFDGLGGLSPIDATYSDLLELLGPQRALEITRKYRSVGANSEVIRVEHEAFFVSAAIAPQDIATAIQTSCPVIKD